MSVVDVRDLNVYCRALKTLDLIYRLIKQLPLNHAKLKKQIVSSAESIPALIAEVSLKKRVKKNLKDFCGWLSDHLMKQLLI